MNILLFRQTHCNNCLQQIECQEGCRVSVLCPSCDNISYCSVQCLKEDKEDHCNECDIMEQLWTIPDITRIMVRLLLKLDDSNVVGSEKLPFSLGERSFEELLSHSDKIEDTDECALQIYETIKNLIPGAVKTWSYFKEVYGKLIINSFEVSGADDEKVGYALYLGPSILDHSCVPSAEVDFSGKRIIVKSKLNIIDINLRKIYISYIDVSPPSDVRRNRLKKYYHFDCFCDRCVGIKLSWVVSEPFNKNLAEILLQKNSIVDTIKSRGKGKDMDYLNSIRCQQCSGRPVKICKDEDPLICSFCKGIVDTVTVKEYFEVKEAVQKVLHMEQIPADAAPQCMELMTGLFYPYDLTYIATCSMAMTDCLLQNRLCQALEFAEILHGIVKKFAKSSPAHVELVQRIMKIQAELGNKSELDITAQSGLVDFYNDTELCTQILRTRDILYSEYFPEE